MPITINDDGSFSASGKESDLVSKMIDTVQNVKGTSRDILLGIYYDTWHAEFGEEVPEEVVYLIKKFIEQETR